MQKKSRIQDVALAAGVSTATVSRALSRPERVSEKTRRVVEQAVKRLHYVPDAAGRALASGRTHTIGCVIPTLDLAIFARSTHALQSTLAQAGYQLLVASHNYDLAVEAELVRAFQQRGVDAMVLVGAEHHAKLWEQVKAWGKPTLLTWVCDERLPSVGFDNAKAASLATGHLIELGHRRVGLISGHTKHNDRAAQRRLGYLQTMREHGLKVVEQMLTEQELSIHGGRMGFRALQVRQQGISALVCGTDMLAIGALLEAQDQGLRVPQDISICGIDNHELGAEIKPRLTTINLPTRELGHIAATQIIRTLAGEPVPDQALLGVDLIVRDSTQALAASVRAR
jgi:LacI family transcriptional regulator